MIKVLKEYVRTAPKMCAYYENRVAPEAEKK